MNDEDQVAIYRGLPYGFRSASISTPSRRRPGLSFEALPEDRRGVATDHEWRNEDDARDLAANLETATQSTGAAAAEETTGPGDTRTSPDDAVPGGDGGSGGIRRAKALPEDRVERSQPEFIGLFRRRPADRGLRRRLQRPRRRPRQHEPDFGAYFFAICLAAHVFLRFRLPYADPYLFPLVALLAAIGLVMLYRIDADLARDKADWFVVGLRPVRADDHLPQGLPRARALPVRDRRRRAAPAPTAADAGDK